MEKPGRLCAVWSQGQSMTIWLCFLVSSMNHGYLHRAVFLHTLLVDHSLAWTGPLVLINHTQSSSLIDRLYMIIHYFYTLSNTKSVSSHVGKTLEKWKLFTRCSREILDKLYLRSGRWCVLLNMFVGQHTWECTPSDQCEQMLSDHLCVWTEGLNVNVH